MNHVYKGIVSITILLTVLQQFPIIRENAYGEIRTVLYFLFILFSLYSLTKLNLNRIPKIILLFIFMTILWLIECSLFLFVSWNVTTSDMIELLIPLGIILTGYCVILSNKSLDSLAIIYGVSATVMAISLIFYYGQGFLIQRQYIQGITKNQVGPIVVVSIIVFLYRLIGGENNKEKKLIINTFVLLMLFLSIYALLLLRNRAGLAALFFVSIVMIYEDFRRKRTTTRMLIALALLVIIIALVQVGLASRFIKTFYDSFTKGFDVENIESLSTGRFNVYKDALGVVKEYPFFGLLNQVETFRSTPHNYILNKLVRYGLLGSLPLIILYLAVIVYPIKEFLGCMKKRIKVDIGIYLVLAAVLISFVEYSYPYGPGVSLILIWFMLAQYMRRKRGRELGTIR